MDDSHSLGQLSHVGGYEQSGFTRPIAVNDAHYFASFHLEEDVQRGTEVMFYSSPNLQAVVWSSMLVFSALALALPSRSEFIHSLKERFNLPLTAVMSKSTMSIPT